MPEIYKYHSLSVKTMLLVFTLFFIPTLFSCKNNNPEQKQYDLLKSNLRYKSYKTISENAIPPLVLLFNTTNHYEDTVVSEETIRLLLGYLWIANDQPDYAIAEGNNILDFGNVRKETKLLAHSIIAIAMYEKGLKTLAFDESNKCAKLIQKMPETGSSDLNIATYHIITGTLCIYNENYQGARFHFAGFNIFSRIGWPYMLADAMADIKEGKAASGVNKIKINAKDKTIPEVVTNHIIQAIKNIEKSTNVRDAKFLWTKDISLALYNEINNSPIKGINKVSELIANLCIKLNVD
ncbi:MAG: hypothetical protein HGB12_17365 [Bacteroidetes bacterium]|nr:hypothetical protein [Bacteroidota bacterium]